MSPVIRWESDDDLLRDSQRASEPLTQYDLAAVGRVRAAATTGAAVILNEVGTPSLWAALDCGWNILCVGTHAELAVYANRAGVIVPGLVARIAPPTQTLPKRVEMHHKWSA
jgi:hypothetical protein